MRPLIALLACGAACAAAPAGAVAQTAPAAELHPLANPSFEAYYVEPGAYRVADIVGWTRVGATRNSIGIQSVSPAIFTTRPGPGGETPLLLPEPADGPQFAFLNPAGDAVGVAIWQPAGPLRARVRYTLTVAVGNRRDKGYFDRVLLELRNGDGPASPLLAASVNAESPPDGGFADHAVTFTTGSIVSGDLVVVIRNQGASQLVVDNVRLTIEQIAPAAAP